MEHDGTADKSFLTSLDTDWNPNKTTPSVNEYHEDVSSVTSCESNEVHHVRAETSVYYTEESATDEDSLDQYNFDNKFEKFFERVKGHYNHQN